MVSSKFTTLLLISLLFISSTTPILGCDQCSKPSPKHKKPITLPPIVKPPINLLPMTNPRTTTKPCPPPPGAQTCPIDTLKLGACVDLLGGLVNIVLGDPVTNQCCPVLQGLVEIEAAMCLCTTLKLNVLNLNIFVPLALQLLVTCGKTPPLGFTCSL
ncbi:pEARLI1-like lipid transfer protein 1 [Camellia sinensis]|uniref:pEARLI1-like lipid transfer protein 1 n=1 Tax=Camellia sinensis TaxID=4442 RepID=UPI001035F21D|nr:pEARLI1-like lipid transfer protein 1 [Camellia sinensis]